MIYYLIKCNKKTTGGCYGKNLRLLRDEKGLSQQKLAEMLNITQQTIFKYEKILVEPDIETLIRLSDIFDVTDGTTLEK